MIRVIVAAVAVVTALHPATVRADSLVPTTVLEITAGRLFFLQDNDDPYVSGQLSGNGFSMPAVDIEGPSQMPYSLLPGSRIDPSFENSGRVVSTLRIGGVDIDMRDAVHFSHVLVQGRIVPVVLPADPWDVVGITFPFLMRWTLEGAAGGTPFRYELVGRGIGNASLLYVGAAGFKTYGAGLSFEAAQPVPEPSALLLLGTGLGMVARRLRRRARATAGNA